LQAKLHAKLHHEKMCANLEKLENLANLENLAEASSGEKVWQRL
jgi:hypothetical protein